MDSPAVTQLRPWAEKEIPVQNAQCPALDAVIQSEKQPKQSNIQ